MSFTPDPLFTQHVIKGSLKHHTFHLTPEAVEVAAKMVPPLIDSFRWARSENPFVSAVNLAAAVMHLQTHPGSTMQRITDSRCRLDICLTSPEPDIVADEDL
jgi:hypothetical protein